MCVKVTKVACFKMASRREGLDLDFSDSGFEENIDSREEFVPADLEADSRDSNNNIFIFIIGIRATIRIKLFFKTVFGQFPLCCWDRERYI